MSDLELPASVGTSDVELPPDIESDAEQPSSGHDVARPGKHDVARPGKHCSCRLKCHSRFAEEVVLEFRQKQLSFPDKDRAASAFTLVRSQVTDKDGNVHLGHIKFSLMDQRVCRPFWEHAHALGHGTIDKYRSMIRDGATELPAAVPRMPSRTAKVQYFKADAWLADLHQDLGEPLAVADPGLMDLDGHALVDDEQHPLWALSMLAADGKHYVPKRYLNPGGFEDLWLMYEAMVSPEEQVSKSTLLKVYRERWDKYLVFRGIGQGKRCRTCAQLDEERLQAAGNDERFEVAAKKRKHIADIMADRNVSIRGNSTSEKDAANPSVDGLGQILKITIDGMDQAKFKVPRNLATSAEWDHLYRPQLHVVGAIVHGHLEAYFIMNSDQAKDANMNATLISRLLDLTREKIDPQCALPRSLLVGADNTTRESKNQHFASYMAHRVTSETFESSEVDYMQTGHTHNEQDQRFSSVASLLSRAPVLEDPEDFAEWIRKHLLPARGRALHVEVVDSTWDFQLWYHKLNVQMSGLAATHLEPDTNHVWRFIRREMMPKLMPGTEVVVTHDAWKDLPPHDKDCVLIVKKYMHSSEVSQTPLLVQPYTLACELKREDLKVMPKTDFGDNVRREFRKTAAHIGNQPWNLLKGQDYLEKLCDANEQGVTPAGPELSAIWDYKIKDLVLQDPLLIPAPGGG